MLDTSGQARAKCRTRAELRIEAQYPAAAFGRVLIVFLFGEWRTLFCSAAGIASRVSELAFVEERLSEDLTLMSKTEPLSKPKAREPYIKPAATKLTVEEAKAVLQEHAEKGNEGAKELLQLISSRSGDMM